MIKIYNQFKIKTWNPPLNLEQHLLYNNQIIEILKRFFKNYLQFDYIDHQLSFILQLYLFMHDEKHVSIKHLNIIEL